MSGDTIVDKNISIEIKNSCLITSTKNMQTVKIFENVHNIDRIFVRGIVSFVDSFHSRSEVSKVEESVG